MPIFSQRRLFSMLTDLDNHLDSLKTNELISRLQHVNTNTALAAEAELSVLWAISRVAHMVPEPNLPNSSNKPDAWSDNLFASAPSVIEVRALSDDNFSGKEAMDRTANIIAAYADQLRKGAGSHLYFEYNEHSYWTDRFHRERCVDPNFQLTTDIKDQLSEWITAPDWPNPEAIRISNEKTDVIISWKKSTVPLFRTFCRMPAVAYDLEDNPIYKALKKKARQVKGVEASTLRCVVLVDAGCSLLRQLRPMSAVHEIGGEAIISHALSKMSIDLVIVISPFRERSFGFVAQSEMVWNITYFDHRPNLPQNEHKKLQNLAAQLPKPHFEGYQARDIHKQGGFSADCRRWHLPTRITTRNGGNMTIKLSTGLLHEYLAGHIDADEFKREAFNDENNFFDLELKRGNSIQKIAFEPGGIDEDDDYVVFDLDIDWDKIAKKHPVSKK